MNCRVGKKIQKSLIQASINQKAYTNSTFFFVEKCNLLPNHSGLPETLRMGDFTPRFLTLTVRSSLGDPFMPEKFKSENVIMSHHR